MSIDLLYELQQDTRRLFIAGSGLAAGDMRLQRKLPQLQKLGEASPIFKRIGESVARVVGSTADGSAAALLDLGNLLYSVLYTQGKTGADAALLPLAGTDGEWRTNVPYRKLQPLLQALTQKGQGRLEVLERALEEGLFTDARVMPAAVQALDDTYSDIPELLQRKVIPAYGTKVLGLLTDSFRLDGGKGASRRLELIHLAQGEAALPLLLKAATEGAVEVRAAAVEQLGSYASQESFLLEAVEDRRKEIRQAAYIALSRLGTPAAVERIRQGLKSKDRDIVIEPARRCEAAALVAAVIQDAEQTVEQIVAQSGGEKAVQQLVAYLQSLDYAKQPEVADLLMRMLSSEAFVSLKTEAAQEKAADLLLGLRLPETDRFMLDLGGKYECKFVAYGFRAALRLLSSAEIYERYAPLLQERRSTPAKALLQTMSSIVSTMSRMSGDRERSPELDADKWDPRWVRLFAGLPDDKDDDQTVRPAVVQDEELVCNLVRVYDPDVEQYLIRQCEARSSSNYRHTQLLLALFRIGSQQAPELLMQLLERESKRRYFYIDPTQWTLMAMMPAAYGDRLRAIADKTGHDELRQRVLDAADALPERFDPVEQDKSEEKGMGIWEWLNHKMR